jgi:hypothetical protein
MQFPEGHEEGPRNIGKTGGGEGKGSGRNRKRAAARQSACYTNTNINRAATNHETTKW